MDDARYKSKQAELFRQHLEVAAELGLNCVIHQRDSLEDTISQLQPFADRVRGVFQGCDDVIAEYHLPASMKLLGAKGSIDWHTEPIHEYRDLWDIDDRIPQLAWLWQLNRGVFKSPGSKWESWTSSIVHTNDDVQRYVDNFAEMAAAITA